MLGYFGIYGGGYSDRIRNSMQQNRSRWFSGRLPHEIGLLNAR
jgi:hypothetical protein